MLRAKERFLREERGFSLSEMMVTIIIMIVVFFALHSIFDMSIKVFSYGNSKAEAMESARVGLEKMEREIRQADGDALIFETWTPTEIRFGNDLDGNGIIQCPNTDPDPQCEKIGYEVYEIPLQTLRTIPLTRWDGTTPARVRPTPSRTCNR